MRLTSGKWRFITQSMQPNIKELKVLDLVPFGHAEPATRFFALRMEHPGWQNWHPGQFLMLKPHSFGLELPWGRPFSICHMTKKHLICFIKTAGKGTDKIAALKPNDKVIVWGPLGNHFALEMDTPTLLLAGGMGIAPFVGYVNRHPHPWNLNMLFAHKMPISCYPLDSINEHITVDSLRESEDGNLDNLLFSMQEKIRDCAEQNGLVLACGPTPFLKTARDFALELGARLQISLENKMACGVGACLGCVCNPSNDWPLPSRLPVPVCTHGPVFWANQIDF